jgi:hypothetical protein
MHNKKSKNRKLRYTFPNELDEYSENTIKHKRRHTVNEYENNYDTYDEQHIIIKKNNDSVQKEVTIKKYTKIHPTVSNDITEGIQESSEYDNTNIIDSVKKSKLLPIISTLIVKLLCYFGIFTCASL